MNIPTVNATATKENREQTKRILRLDGQSEAWIGGFVDVNLPNGSFTLDQVVWMLEAEGWVWFWQDRPFPDSGWINTKKLSTIIKTPLTDENAYRAPDLTATMDAYIKVLEAKS